MKKRTNLRKRKSKTCDGVGTEILLDYDVPSVPRNRITEVARILASKVDIHFTHAKVLRTAHGWHVVLITDRILEPAEIVALQAVLGSDFRREAFNWCRLHTMKVQKKEFLWNILFETKLHYDRKGRARVVSQERNDRKEANLLLARLRRIR